VHRLRFAFRLALLAALGLPGARPAAARHVVVAVIDGPRATEFLEEPGRPHAPVCDGTLIPAGAWIPDFLNLGWTLTMNGHSALITGTRQDIANDGSERPDRPTLFELLRKHAGAGPDDVWIVAGKQKLDALGYSTHPDYGSAYGAQVDASLRADAATLAAAVSVLQTWHPRLLLINFASVDLAGHGGVWTEYLSALSAADSLVGELWQAIEADPVLGGDTDLFVAADHGRHDDAHGGFQNHGDDCTACRRLPGIALGPDIKTGFVSSEAHRQEDVAATAAWILGVAGTGPPQEGLVMIDLLVNPPATGAPEPVPSPTLAAYPNPFRGSIALRLPGDRPRDVAITDVAGRRVWSVSGVSGEVIWPGRDGFGSLSPAGVYWVRVGSERPLRVVRIP